MRRLSKTDSKTEGRRGRSRARRVTDALVGTLLTAYLLLLCFPQIVFAHSTTYRHFRVYSAAPLGADIRAVLDRADRRLTGCEIDDTRTVHRIFLCPGHAAFALLAPGAHAAFADNVPFVHNIFVNTANIKGDAVTSGAGRHGRRTLSGVIAHECTHTLLAERFGQFAMLRQPSWKQEGYCDWVAGSTSFDPAAGARLLAQGQGDPSPSFFYFRAYTAVSYLEERRHWSVAQIMATPLSLNAVLNSSRAAERVSSPPSPPA